MNNLKFLFLVLVLLVAGSLLIGAFPNRPNHPPPASQKPPLPKNDFSLDFNLPSLIALIIWPTAVPTPTSSLPTPPPNPPPTPTTDPNQPTPTPNPGGACSEMDNGLPNSRERYANGSTSLPSTTREICAFSGNQYYSLPYRNRNCSVTQSGINKAYDRMKTYYPAAYWQNTKLLTEWRTVQQYSIQYNFNPLFVIALWIEESAAGGATNAQQLGCLYRLNKDDSYTFLPPNTNICGEMECLFGLRSVDPANYALWACQYRWGASQWQNNHCLEVTGFTKGIEFWYNYIGENLSGSCQIRYFSNPDPGC